MEIPPLKRYENIVVSGLVSVEQVELIPDEEDFKGFLILGPTGSGKSTFIEALANDESLTISSGQLEGFTQSISTYRVINVTHEGYPLYVVDVPGFADTKMSEKRIVIMVKEWIRMTKSNNIGRILYVTPINAVRLSGSHREVLQTFQALTGVSGAGNVTIVSTMWDSIWGNSATERSIRNFNQLENDIWKDYIEQGSPIVKFYNTQDSALSILDIAISSFSDRFFNLEIHMDNPEPLRETPFGNNLYDNLRIRIRNLHIERTNILLDMEGITAKSDDDLMAVLRQHLEEADRCIANFEEDLREFDTPVESSSPRDPEGENSPSTSAVAGVRQGGPSTNSQPITNIEHGAAERTALRTTYDVVPPYRGRISKVVGLVKCWGKSVGERHDD